MFKTKHGGSCCCIGVAVPVGDDTLTLFRDPMSLQTGFSAAPDRVQGDRHSRLGVSEIILDFRHAT